MDFINWRIGPNKYKYYWSHPWRAAEPKNRDGQVLESAVAALGSKGGRVMKNEKRTRANPPTGLYIRIELTLRMLLK
jgi:hypothetical protein